VETEFYETAASRYSVLSQHAGWLYSLLQLEYLLTVLVARKSHRARLKHELSLSFQSLTKFLPLGVLCVVLLTGAYAQVGPTVAFVFLLTSSWFV
jgi:hypothetical protein